MKKMIMVITPQSQTEFMNEPREREREKDSKYSERCRILLFAIYIDNADSQVVLTTTWFDNMDDNWYLKM